MAASPARLLVVVPAWNEEEALPAVLAEVAATIPHADVLVVDDGSRDSTSDVARAGGAAVLRLPFNLGVGGAMRAGYRYAQRHGYDVAVQLDADGQHDPRHVAELVDALGDEGADLVLGARFAGVGSFSASALRRATMRVLAGVLSRVTGTRLTDATSGFKAAGPRAIRLFAADYPAEYLGDTVEALVIAARAGLVVRQVPVAMRPRAGGTPSHGPVKSAIFLVRAMFALLIALSRPSAR